jgi:Fic family protein
VVAANGRVEALMRGKTEPQNRPEGEIAGYRDVLATIHAHSADIRLDENVVLQFHRDLMKYATGAGGAWKSALNEIVEVRPDGMRRIRFIPTAPHLTPAAMQALRRDFAAAMWAGRIEPLILIALYVLDFLCVHPFLDGNRRMARLLTVLVLHQQGYEVGRYVSLERLIEQTKESYYDTLYRASQDWHESKHDPMPWIAYWLGTVLAAYREFRSLHWPAHDRPRRKDRHRALRHRRHDRELQHFRACRRLPQRQPRLDQDRARPAQEGRPAQAFRPRADRPLAQSRNGGVRREMGDKEPKTTPFRDGTPGRPHGSRRARSSP